MPHAGNLTREVARHRSRTVTLHDHAVHLDLTHAPDADAAEFTSTSRLRLTCTEPSVEIDLVADDSPQVTLDGKDVAVGFADSRVRIDGLTPGASHDIVITARCTYSHTGEGLHRYHDPEDGQTYLFTHFEPTDARRVFACFDQPDLKARFAVSVTAPTGWQVRSNGAPSAQEEISASEINTAENSTFQNGTTLTHFTPTEPLSSYLVCVIAGPYHVVEDAWTSDDGRTIPLAVLCRPSMAANLPSADILRWTKAGLPWCERAFGYRYPWGTYDQVFVPEYNIGAMENPGLVTFNEGYLKRGDASLSDREALATTLLHEMAHIWFGDLVTMPWWDDLWLKESFADFIGAQAASEVTEFEDAWLTFSLDRKAWAYAADQLPTTHPIVADIPDVEAARANFDGITYAKGASVLRQLVAYVGEEAFYGGVKAYFARHAFANASLNDLLVELSAASGRDMTAWSRAWLQTAGPDTLWLDADGLHRESIDAVTGEPAARPHRLQVTSFAVTPEGWAPIDSDWIDVADTLTPVSAFVPTEGRVTLVDDGSWTYAKVVPDVATLDAMTAQLAGLEPASARGLAWGQLWQACRDARLPAERFVRTVLTQLPHEKSPGLVAAVSGFAHTAVGEYLPTASRDAWGDALWRAALGAHVAALADSDTDLALAWRGAILSSSGLSPAAVGPMQAMLVGADDTPFRPDDDERWSLLTALAARNAVPDEVLTEEKRRDPTTRGATHLLAARAARGDAATKAEAWGWTDDAELTNDAVLALVSGLTHPVTRGLLAPFETSYVEHLERWWQERSQVIASRLARGLFAAVQDDRVAQEWLDSRPQAPGALRRIVIEELDRHQRAERARRASDGSRP